MGVFEAKESRNMERELRRNEIMVIFEIEKLI